MSDIELPKVNEIVVYLDFNIFVSAIEDKLVFQIIRALSAVGTFVFPYSHVHIHEVNRIDEDDIQSIERHLSVIRSISNCKYIDFNERIKRFTIRPRDPSEVYNSISQVPRAFVHNVSKMAVDYYLKDALSLPEDCYRLPDVYAFLAKSCRKEIPNVGRHINNLSREQALAYLKENIFGDTIKQSFPTFCKILAEHDLGQMSFEKYCDFILYALGFKTPASDLGKPGGLLSDHQHLDYASNCPVVLSDDLNFRRKLMAKFKSTEKLVLPFYQGALALGVLAGLFEIRNENGVRIESPDFARLNVESIQNVFSKLSFGEH